MKRLDYKIEKEWEEIRKNSAAVMKRVHVDHAVRPCKNPVSNAKIENNRNLRDAMGFRFGMEPSYEEPVRPPDTSAWEKARRTKPAPVRPRNAPAWEEARHVKPPPTRSPKAMSIRKGITNRISDEYIL